LGTGKQSQFKAKQSQLQDVGLGAVWIPAFAGMTNVEIKENNL
jgi:hypothetical protein